MTNPFVTMYTITKKHIQNELINISFHFDTHHPKK